MLSKARGKRFQLILIKPSHYDADGYVVQWLRSTMPSNSLAAVYSLARGFRAAGVQVMIGGFHVSGCLAMLKEMQTDIKVAQDLGVSIFAGEAEEGLDEVLLDAAKGEL